eukprot:13743102-Alexandrium_andersonii.AAC.1
MVEGDGAQAVVDATMGDAGDEQFGLALQGTVPEDMTCHNLLVRFESRTCLKPRLACCSGGS